jgi:hypothetical protein
MDNKFNDFSNQMIENGEHSINFKTSAFPAGMKGIPNTVSGRGYSRQSKISSKGNRSINVVVSKSREFQSGALSSHPNTAGSHKRSLPSSQS